MIDSDPIGWFITFSIIIGALAMGMLIAEVFMFFDRDFLNHKNKDENNGDS
tara:strand:- start:185 stop:337 length:153 start_codon:yes stop_codon:yes gene_type:complete